MAAGGQQYMPIPNEPKEIEVIPISKKPIRRIFKCPEAVPKLGELHMTSPPKFVFGPFYRQLESSTSGKDDAWRKLVEKEGGNQDKTMESYMSAMRRIEKKARAAYGDGALNGLTESQFRHMMIKDGCFFLQLVLYILGASVQLGYPANHLIFGKKQSKKTFQGWIKSMFLVGNQIPLVVLNELMKHIFFQMVIKDMERERPSDMLSKQILYDLLVFPALEHSNSITSSKILKKLARKTFFSDQEQPSEVLHGLQLFLLGPGGSRTGSTENEREDELEDVDFEAGIKLKSRPKAKNNANEDKKDNEKQDDERKELCTSDLQNRGIYMKDSENKDDERKKLSASDLQNKGIYIWNSKRAGSRGIDFTNWIIFGSLTLPTLKVSHDTSVLFTNLKYYEIAQQQKEVRSYLRFLSELISTYEDINVLASKGIIEASTSDEKERFLEMLRTLADRETTHHHRSVIGRVKDYSVFPWERFKYVAIIVFFLTIAQTVFGVLSYVIGVKQLHEPRG